MASKPVINCHTHIFTGDSVPPWLAKKFLPWPFYYLLPVTGLVRLCRAWFKGPHRWRHRPWHKKITRAAYRFWIFISRNYIATTLHTIVGVVLTYHVLFFIWDWLGSFTSGPEGWLSEKLLWFRQLVQDHHLEMPIARTWLKLLCILILLTLFPSGRNLVLFVLRKSWKLLRSLPGEQTMRLLDRYMNLGRFSFHTKQATILGRLIRQYEPGTAFVILPMDMDFMGAGAAPVPYREQMEELARLKNRKDLKNIIHPFVFADPRRMEKEADYFRYRVEDGKVVLEDCFIKTYIETHGFRGIKIYPALGYYPFDEKLLPLWKYAADNGIPVMTHCIKGTIFYRGRKKKEWGQHPVFKQAMGNDDYQPLLLPQKKNIDFSLNFTHPLNYLCLLNETLLLELVQQSKDPQLHAAFGYDAATRTMQHDLKNLRLCFGHFGGEDQWERFFEHDRENYSARLFTHPERGLEFLTHEDGEPAPGKPEQVWKGVDWYTIICSLMLQYDQVYADISYILHDGEAVFPLLKQTLQQKDLRGRVLYGTDFYVVRNHKSDKHLHASMLTGLSEEEFELIASINPTKYLR